MRSPKDLGLPRPSRVSKTAVRRLEKLIQTRSTKELSREELRDEQTERLMSLVKRNMSRHKDVVEADVAERGPAKVVDLMEVLKKSLARKRAA